MLLFDTTLYTVCSAQYYLCAVLLALTLLTGTHDSVQGCTEAYALLISDCAEGHWAQNGWVNFVVDSGATVHCVNSTDSAAS